MPNTDTLSEYSKDALSALHALADHMSPKALHEQPGFVDQICELLEIREWHVALGDWDILSGKLDRNALTPRGEAHYWLASSAMANIQAAFRFQQCPERIVLDDEIVEQYVDEINRSRRSIVERDESDRRASSKMRRLLLALFWTGAILFGCVFSLVPTPSVYLAAIKCGMAGFSVCFGIYRVFRVFACDERQLEAYWKELDRI